MCWIDESMDGDVPPFEFPYHATGTQRDNWTVQDGIDKYEAHLASYRAIVKKLPAVRAGCLVPPMTCQQPMCSFYGDIRDVLPPGYDPPDEISVEEFPRYNPGPTVPLSAFTSDFNRICDGLIPDYVVLIVDTSGSMDRSNIETGYSEETAPDNFIYWLGTNYAGAQIIRVDGTDGKYFVNEEWIGAINIELQDIIDGL